VSTDRWVLVDQERGDLRHLVKHTTQRSTSSGGSRTNTGAGDPNTIRRQAAPNEMALRNLDDLGVEEVVPQSHSDLDAVRVALKDGCARRPRQIHRT